MQKDRIISIGVVALLVAVYMLSAKTACQYGYVKGGEIKYHFIYMFFHANIFHLFANSIAAYYSMRSCRRIIISYSVSVLCSFFSFSALPTIGFSAPIYVAIGMGLYPFNKNRKTLPVIIMICYMIAGLFITKINGLLHLSCLGIGFIVSFLLNRLKKINDDYRRTY